MTDPQRQRATSRPVTSAYPLTPPVRAGGELVETLEAAAVFMRAHGDAPAEANTEGTLRRVEGAQTEQQKAEAADAFRGWIDAVGLGQHG